MKTSLITGIGRGIGKALVEKFLKENWNVIGTVLSSATPFSHAGLVTYQMDLSDPASISKRTEQIIKSGVKIDVLINNAGGLYDEDDTRLIVDKLRKTLEVNLIGTIDFAERIIPVINKNGHIVSISSAAGSLSDMDHVERSHFPYHYPAYKISKVAINMYTRTLARRLDHEDDRGIIVSSVHPGWVKTAMGGDEAPTTADEAARHIYELAISRPETGQFWYEGKKYPW